ncbi:MAG: NHLP bacteriocin export ABC transporter permease/ATPase subunit, partial [Acidobacteriota bacterium]
APESPAGPAKQLPGDPVSPDLERATERPLVEALGRDGELVHASGNRPFLLEPKDTAWFVESGKVEIFTVALDADGAPTGARTHFCSVETGALMMGMDFEGYAMGSGFLAVGRMGTRLRRVGLGVLRALAADPRCGAELAEAVDGWIGTLSRSLTAAITPGPIVDVNLAEDEEATLESQQKARSNKGVVWLDVVEGNVLFVGMEELVFQKEKAKASPAAHSMLVSLKALFEEAQQQRVLFPVSSDTWVEASNARDLTTRLRSHASASVVAEGGFWRGLEVFHQTLCQCEFINKRLATLDEFNRLRTKAEYSEAAREAGYREIAGVLEGAATGRFATARGDGADLVFEAARLVGDAQGLAVKQHPEANRRANFGDRVAAIAKASQCRTRAVMLRDDWYRSDAGPILGRWEKTGDPVALLPEGPTAYRAVDPRSGASRKVDEQLAAELAPFGTVLYRPFPEGDLSALGLIRFGARGLGPDAVTLVVMGVAMGMLGAITPYFTGRIFDGAIPQADRNLLVQFTLGLFVGALVSTAFKLTQSFALMRIQGKMDYSIQAALWDRLMNLPSNFFRGYSAGDLSDRAQGIGQIRQLIAGAGVGAILGSLSSVFYVFLLFKYSLVLAFVAIGLTMLYVTFTTTCNYLQLRHERHQMEVRGRITGLVLQFISGVAKLRVAGAENHAFRVWASQYASQRRIEFRVGRIKNAVQVFGAGFPVLSSMAIFYALVKIQEAALAKGQTQPMTTGDFIAFNAAFMAFLGATQALGDASLDMLRVIPIFERLRPIITTPAELDESKTYPGRLKGGIEVSHVSFRYSEDSPWILDDLTVRLEPGEFVAFVGGSGCGKSTLMRLLLGFETPQKGAVFFDGQDLASLDLREVRQQIGVVLQTSKLLPTDIFRNIIGSTDLGINDAWEAATLAGVADDIRQLPMGMHTYISEGGGGFSGGQQQKLLIARALVRKPRVLIFDEATSALDNKSQKTVTESMERLQATRIVIAHRLSTIINADRICYLEGGRVIEMGTYDDLMKLDGKFALLAKRQMA